MRRRVQIDPESGYLEDHTDSPGSVNESGSFFCKIGTALYDEVVWERYQEACRALTAARCAVIEMLVDEPLDEVELALAEEFEMLFRENDNDKMTSSEFVARHDVLRERARVHSATRTSSTNDLGELLKEFGDPEYTREKFDEDRARLLAVICTKHGITEAEVDVLIKEHRYSHSFDDPEDEYIGIMAMARAAGWL